MKKLVVILLVAIMVAAIVMRRTPRSRSTPHPRDAERRAATAPIQASEAGSGSAAAGARKLSVEDRRALRAQIETALQHRRSPAGTSAGSSQPSATPDEDPILSLEQAGKAAQDALKRAIPLLADCYKGSATDRTALAQMVMISDPELGTVIDTSTITGADGTPLAPALDDCLRTTIESLALPPLGVPGKLPLQYSFRFD